MEIIIIVVTLIIDQIVKNWAHTSLITTHGGSIKLIEGVFHFTYVENTGAAFGILSNAKLFFLIVAPVCAVLIAFYLFKNKKTLPKIARIALALMISGALGNWVDRLKFGYVRDMFDFTLINFAVFNVADICVSVAVVIMLYYIFFVEGKTKKVESKTKK